jgi:transposase
MHQFVNAYKDEPFVKQIHLIESYKGAGFLSAVTLMCEIGDFAVFQKPKQLYASAILSFSPLNIFLFFSF